MQKLFWVKEVASSEVFYSRFHFKCSFLFRSFSTREKLIIRQTAISPALPRATRFRICISNLMYKSMHEFVWYRVTCEIDWKNFEKVINMAEKRLRKSSIFRNVTGCHNFVRVSVHFEKIKLIRQGQFSRHV